jgi:hypothetical protein
MIRARLRWGLLLVASGMFCSAADLQRLSILKDHYPRAFFFRLPEAGARVFEGANKNSATRHTITYEEWEKTFGRLQGMEVKVLNEELPTDARRDLEWSVRFKKSHPDQLLLLHFNGDARDPRWECDKFFAGHWLYTSGSRVTGDIPQQPGETDIHVSNVSRFRTGVGRFRKSVDDIGIAELDAQGQPDWKRSEQVVLVSVDPAAGTIRVRRGQYGSQTRAFAAGKAYAAAHVTEGPWTNDSHLLWCYNFSTQCPKDAQGKTCNDVLVEDLAHRFRTGAQLESFDGLEFDAMRNQLRTRPGDRQADVDNDGEDDDGFVGGVNVYGAGVVQFLKKLRSALGPDRIIQADGQEPLNQRGFHILNGIESEGFPSVQDYAMKDWSGGLNRILFWKANSAQPFFSYINHKFNMTDPKTGGFKLPDIPNTSHRLVFAVGTFTDSAMGYLLLPTPEQGELVGVWDELQMGVEHRLGWLGKPMGPTVHVAEHDRKLLPSDLLKQFQGDGVTFSREGSFIKIASRDRSSRETHFRLTGIPVSGPDLYVKIEARGDHMQGYPAEYARMMWVTAGGQKHMAFVNGTVFKSDFYFLDLPSGQTDLDFSIEGSEPVWISAQAFAQPDALYREFEDGVVLGNPAGHPYTFKLAELLPGRHYRRLKASPHQDTQVNNGERVPAEVTLAAKDGLFLVKE